MGNQSIFRKRLLPLSHLPTLFLVIGYPMYWLELYILKAGQARTTPLSWIFFCVFAVVIFLQNYPRLKPAVRKLRTWFLKEPPLTRLLLILMAIASLAILLCAFYASLLPPHLDQEYDALNYHITLPRQHLILGSFSHIPWSSADLFFLPIDFALSSFWLSTPLPNKLPQFFFVLGLLGICMHLAKRFSDGKIWPSVLLTAAILGSHNIVIQMGTAMLDIVICYLFFAAFDSLLNRTAWLAAVELSFYVWSKPLIPVQVLATLLIFILVWLLLRICGNRKNVLAASDEKAKQLRPDMKLVLAKGFGLFLLFSLFVAGPFIFKSLRFAGTPLFPVGVGAFRTLSTPQTPQRWAELKLGGARLLALKDQYGSGQNLLEFARHFWLAAVPEKRATNRFDYPMGLVYLLFLGPFLFYFFSCLRQKAAPLLSLWVVVSWGIWWFGSQQTRYLYVPLILMYLAVVLSIRTPSPVFLGTMLCAILLTSLAIYWMNKQDLGRWGESVLRQKDKELIQMGKVQQPASRVALPFFDVAYATFPVEVVDNGSVFVLQTALGKDQNAL